MQKSKKLFLVLALIFFFILIWIAYDFSRRTSFPGTPPIPADSTQQDTVQISED